jgi:predicted nucleic acid-binding protein
MAILIDTNALLAYASSKDRNHQPARQFFLSSVDELRVVPAPVLSELFYMVTVRINYRRAIEIFRQTQTAFQIEPLIASDMTRMQTIMSKYADAELDYTDVAILAVAERLNITRICTFDRRDFQIYQPTHCSHFELLP